MNFLKSQGSVPYIFQNNDDNDTPRHNISVEENLHINNICPPNKARNRVDRLKLNQNAVKSNLTRFEDSVQDSPHISDGNISMGSLLSPISSISFNPYDARRFSPTKDGGSPSKFGNLSRASSHRRFSNSANQSIENIENQAPPFGVIDEVPYENWSEDRNIPSNTIKPRLFRGQGASPKRFFPDENNEIHDENDENQEDGKYLDSIDRERDVSIIEGNSPDRLLASRLKTTPSDIGRDSKSNISRSLIATKRMNTEENKGNSHENLENCDKLANKNVYRTCQSIEVSIPTMMQGSPHEEANTNRRGRANVQTSHAAPLTIETNVNFDLTRSQIITNNSQVTQQQLQPSSTALTREDLELLEAKLYIKRAVGLLIAVSLIYIVSLVAPGDLSNFQVAVILYGYFTYCVIDSGMRVQKYRRQNWRTVEDIFYSLDCIGGAMFVLSVNLKVLQIISISLISCVPFMGSGLAYSLIVESPTFIKRRNTFLRLFYTVQVFMITAKLDGLFNMDWRIILATMLPYLLLVGGYVFLHAFQIIMVLKTVILRENTQGNAASVKLIGNAWCFLFYGLRIIGFFFLIDLFQRTFDEKQNISFSRVINLIGLLTSILLIAFTGLAYKSLLGYIKISSISHVLMTAVQQIEAPKVQKQEVNLQVEKKDSYFVMLSTTYFRTLDKDFFKRDKAVLQKLRSTFFSPKVRKLRLTVDDKPNASQDTLHSPAKMQLLTQQKHDSNTGMALKKAPSIPKHPDVLSELPCIKELSQQNRYGGFQTFEDLTGQTKHNLSADDIATMKEIYMNRSQKTIHNDEKLCYLCYDNAPNAILMNCKHGGICYECAISLVKKKNECMECRSTVDAIYKVDHSLKLTDVMKATEMTKVTKVEVV